MCKQQTSKKKLITIVAHRNSTILRKKLARNKQVKKTHFNKNPDMYNFTKTCKMVQTIVYNGHLHRIACALEMRSNNGRERP